LRAKFSSIGLFGDDAKQLDLSMARKPARLERLTDAEIEVPPKLGCVERWRVVSKNPELVWNGVR
jgi:hypothetical protein